LRGAAGDEAVSNENKDCFAALAMTRPLNFAPLPLKGEERKQEASAMFYRCITVFLALFTPCFVVPFSGHAAVISNIAAVNGAKISYEIQGEGPTLVLLNDGILDRRMWNDQVAAFSKDYKVIRYDFRGWGKSELPQQPFSHVDDLYQLLQFLHVEKAALLGVLAGGGVALDFALDHPEMVDRIIVVTPLVYGFHYSPPTHLWMQAWHALAQAGEKSRLIDLYMSTPALGRRLSENVAARKRLEAMLSDNFAVYGVDFSQLLLRLDPPTMQLVPAIRTPTLILAGTTVDPDLRLVMEFLQRGIHDARQIVLPNTGSLMNMEKPEAFNRVVLDWLSKRPADEDATKIGL
jgi:pimeloyl-ACP methyl ester carboxylesterase